MTTTTTSNGSAPRTMPIDLSTDSLRILPDETERWITYPDEGVPFETAAQAVLDAAAEDGERDDIGIARLDTYAFGPMPDGTAALATVPAPGRERRMVPLRATAFAQLCERAGAPAPYIRKLPAKLQMACVNVGMQRDAKQTGNCLRLAGGEARALLSDRYAPLDNGLVLDVLHTTLRAAGMLDSVRVRSVAVGPTCSFRFTFPEHSAIVKGSRRVGDVTEVGMDLLNGEMGNRSVSLTPLLYQLICLNGMRSTDKSAATRLSHIGDPKRLEEAFRDAVPTALAAAHGLRKRVEESVGILVDDILDEMDVLKTFGLGAADTREVVRDVFAERAIALPEKTDDWADAFASARDVSAYDVLNGITHVAQRHGTDRRLELEDAAGAYLLRRTRD